MAFSYWNRVHFRKGLYWWKDQKIISIRIFRNNLRFVHRVPNWRKFPTGSNISLSSSIPSTVHIRIPYRRGKGYSHVNITMPSVYSDSNIICILFSRYWFQIASCFAFEIQVTVKNDNQYNVIYFWMTIFILKMVYSDLGIISERKASLVCMLFQLKSPCWLSDTPSKVCVLVSSMWQVIKYYGHALVIQYIHASLGKSL